MSQHYCTGEAAPREAFPSWLFGSELLPRLLPGVACLQGTRRRTRARAYTLHSPAKTGLPPPTWTSGCVPAGYPAAAGGGTAPGVRTFLTPLPCPGATLVSERAGFGGGLHRSRSSTWTAPSSSQGCRRTNRVALSRHPRFHAYVWTDQPMPPEDRPWGELRESLNEYCVAPGSSFAWGRYTPVEPFQISFWPTNADTKTSASQFQLDSARDSETGNPHHPPVIG